MIIYVVVANINEISKECKPYLRRVSAYREFQRLKSIYGSANVALWSTKLGW